MSKTLPANRVAALATFFTGLAGCGTSLANVWPSGVTTEIALVAGGVATLAGPLAHIAGSILWDRTPAGQAPRDVLAPPAAPIVAPAPAPRARKR